MSKSVWGICALVASLFLTSAPFFSAQADATPNLLHGKLLFLRCAACHDIANRGAARIGPNLEGVVGRKAGSLPGYDYSAAMKSQNFVWDLATLDRWLKRPNEVVPGTSMAFGGLEKAEDRQALITYLSNFPAK